MIGFDDWTDLGIMSGPSFLGNYQCWMVVELTETGESGKWIHFSGKVIKNKCEHGEVMKDSMLAVRLINPSDCFSSLKFNKSLIGC